MNILVTAGLGFIVHKVVKQLESMDHNVIVVDNKSTYKAYDYNQLRLCMDQRSIDFKTKHIYPTDLLMKESVEHLFNTYKPEIVVHLASIPRQSFIDDDVIRTSKVMCEGLVTLLELSKKYKVDKFVYAKIGRAHV